MNYIFTQETAKSAKFYFPLCFTLALEWSQTSLRQECAESLSTPSPLRGTRPCLRGRKWVIALHSCNYSPPYREGPWVGLFSKKLYTPLCTVLGGEILVSSRLGPRMKSVWNMNSQTHDNMSASHWRCGNVNGRVPVHSLLLVRSA